MPKMPPALKACYHLERRYRTDADFAHVMQATESMKLIQDAITDHAGLPSMTFDERLRDQQHVSHEWNGEVARLERDNRRLEKEVSELQNRLAAHEDGPPVFVDASCGDDTGFSLSGVLEVIEQARWRGINITPDQLTDALEGRRVFL